MGRLDMVNRYQLMVGRMQQLSISVSFQFNAFREIFQLHLIFKSTKLGCFSNCLVLSEILGGDERRQSWIAGKGLNNNLLLLLTKIYFTPNSKDCT